MGKIVVIGGGEIGRPGFPVETTELDKHTIKLTGKSNPNLLFLPTASSDSEGYVDCVRKHFGETLGCNIDYLSLISQRYSHKELSDRILGANIIYVGGGNTLKMMRRWRFLGVDVLLKRAYEKGTVLSGLSAGGICWFDSGHSDSMQIYGKENWEYINVRGLGLIKGIHCPHFDSDTNGISRKKDFTNFMKKRSKMGIGIDEKCAIEFVNDGYRVISTNNDSKAYKVFRLNGEIKIEEIKKSNGFNPVSQLYEKY
ncbi:peptidase E [Candidatus Woesearchaeota archaeon]|jgi:dipeptidase E|nr:peptidase E [Candidatus Woesearchaeota archaeon]MBT4150422.1 peptidase E [Candidatus Woesearchaeota archaeon]MBT4247503.1 peptidase E [Candidatus Woesearchaeota archaeon]MBT4434458.1 peptidase E [Candidatus Woesearchaeota archaeon]MBT7331688.1 peptidase E [Candidatus Woesearchaeota archaeon]